MLFVFNRHKQLAETLECLKNVPLLYVFSDGPRDQSDEDGIQKVRSLIDGISWTKVKRVYRSKNMGLSQSIQDGLSEVFKNYDKVIVVEDDICVAPDFYSFMTACLNRYQDSPKIAGVTGLRYPFSRRNLNSDPYDVFITPRFSSWGWGTWKRQWQTLSFDSKDLLKKIKRSKADLAAGGAGLPYAAQEIEANRLSGYWDITFYLNMILNKQFFVWPKQNYVINTGLTEGSHASGIPEPHWKLRWEKRLVDGDPWQLPSQLSKNGKILSDFLAFFEPSNLDKLPRKQQLKQLLRKLKLNLKIRKRHMAKTVKSLINKALHKAGYHVSKLDGAPAETSPQIEEPTQPEVPALKASKPNPKDYSTTYGPMEVPCQKETYYFALNNYVKPGDKVLDVGSGLGYGMTILSTLAKEVHGIDIDKKAIAYSKKEVFGKNPKIKSIQYFDGYRTPFKNSEFDVVTCVDVIEHVEKYDEFIKELLRISKNALIFSSPNRRAEFTNPDGTPRNYWHLREWRHKELDEILSKHQAKVDWFFIDGPFNGPFKILRQVSKDTLVLLPVLHKDKQILRS